MGLGEVFRGGKDGADAALSGFTGSPAFDIVPGVD